MNILLSLFDHGSTLLLGVSVVVVDCCYNNWIRTGIHIHRDGWTSKRVNTEETTRNVRNFLA